MERLQKGFKELCALRASSPVGLKLASSSDESRQLTNGHLFSSDTSYRGLHIFSAAPFLVSAVLDALKSSRFADRVKLVPDEADVYCANYAKRHGGVVLTNDSDLAVHDLGRDGEMAFLDSLQLTPCSLCGSSAVTAKIISPEGIAKKMNISDLKRFAFEIQQDYTISAGEAIRRAQGTLRPAKGIRYDDFRRDYEGTASRDHTSREMVTIGSLQHLDPRLSEFILQVRLSSEPPLHVYLPTLLENPSIASAWEVSLDMRRFSYSLVLIDHQSPPAITVLEYSRCDKWVIPFELDMMDTDQCITLAETFIQQIRKLKEYHDGPLDTVFWRAFAMLQILRWYLTTGRSIPSSDIVKQVMNRADANTIYIWSAAHLDAQIQAVLYALRQTKQTIDCLDSAGMHPALAQMAEYLKSLPMLKSLLQPVEDGNDRHVDVKGLEKLARSFANLSSPSELAENDQELPYETVTKAFKSKKKRIKREKEKEGQVEKSQAKAQKASAKPNNIYGVLQGLV